MSNIKRKLLFGGMWALVGRLSLAVFSIVVNGLLARLLSPAEMGVYFISLTIAMTVAAIAPLGMNHSVVRLVSEGLASNQSLTARNSIALSLLLTFFVSVAVGLLYVSGFGAWLADTIFHSVYLGHITYLLAGWLILRSMQDVMAECFRGYHAIGKSVMFGGVISTLIYLGLLSFFKFTSGNMTLSDAIFFIVIALLVNLIIASVVIYKDLFKGISTTLISIQKSVLITHLKISIPMWGSATLFIVLSQLDLWVLGVFRSEEEVALYGAALKLVMLVGMPLMIINAVVPPIIAELNCTKQYFMLEKSLRSAASIAAIPAFIASLAFVFFGEDFLQLVYGEYYAAANAILVILCIGQFVAVWGGACGYALNMSGYQRDLLQVMGASLLIAAMLIVPAAIYYGAIGVAVVTILWQIFLHVSALLMTKKKVGVWTHMDIYAMRPSNVVSLIKQYSNIKT